MFEDIFAVNLIKMKVRIPETNPISILYFIVNIKNSDETLVINLFIIWFTLSTSPLSVPHNLIVYLFDISHGDFALISPPTHLSL